MEQRAQSDVATTALLVCGAIAGPLFVIAFLIEGATRADYNPLRHPVSSLALGDNGWTQTANFIITGLLMLAFAVGLRRALVDVDPVVAVDVDQRAAVVDQQGDRGAIGHEMMLLDALFLPIVSRQPICERWRSPGLCAGLV